MKYTKLGNTGVDVSKICMGMMSFGKPGSENGLFPWARDFDDAKPIFQRAIELGVNFFDTANVYQMGSSEIVTGQLIKAFNLDRDDIVVSTKVNFPMRPDRPNGGGLSRKNIMAEIDHSLKRLQLDYVDLYQIHRLDPHTPMEETMEALHDVVKSGKARYIGASSMYAWQFERLQNIAEKNNWTRFVSMQNHYSLIHREEEREMIPLCENRGVALIPWSPLAGGRVTRPWGHRRSVLRLMASLHWSGERRRRQIKSWSITWKKSHNTKGCRWHRWRLPGSSVNRLLQPLSSAPPPSTILKTRSPRWISH